MYMYMRSHLSLFSSSSALTFSNSLSSVCVELWLEMYSVETAVSESKKFVYIEVIADRIVEAHVTVRLFPAPSDKSSSATGMVSIYHVIQLH